MKKLALDNIKASRRLQRPGACFSVTGGEAYRGSRRPFIATLEQPVSASYDDRVAVLLQVFPIVGEDCRFCALCLVLTGIGPKIVWLNERWLPNSLCEKSFDTRAVSMCR